MHQAFFHQPSHVVLKHWRQHQAALIRVGAATPECDADVLLLALACFVSIRMTMGHVVWSLWQ